MSGRERSDVERWADGGGESGADFTESTTRTAQSRTDCVGKLGGGEKERDVDRWKESEDDLEEGFGESAGNGSSRQPNSAGATTGANGNLKRERARRAVTSESWDDDFLFQHETASSNLQRRSPPRSPSRPSRPTSPLQSKQSAVSPSFRKPSHVLSPTTPSPTQRSSFPTAPYANPLTNLANPSLDSLVSSLDWDNTSEQEEPTLKLNVVDPPTPKPPSRDLPSAGFHRAHRSNASTSTTRPSTSSSQQTINSAALSQIPRRSPPLPLSLVASSRVPSNATTNRSETPSLTADSLRSLTSTTTTGDELRTETEDDEDGIDTEDEIQRVPTSPRSGLFGFKRFSQEIVDSIPIPTSPNLKPSNSRRWKFGRSKKEPSEAKESGQKPNGIFGRRTGPRELEEVGTLGRDDPDSHEHHMRRSELPLPVRDGQPVVLGRRTRTQAEPVSPRELNERGPFRLAAPPRARLPNPASPATNDSGTRSSRIQRSSLQALPSRYDSKKSIFDGEETTEADVSEFSGDERFHLPTRLHNRSRSIATATPSTSRSPHSPTFPSDSARPCSPVESILGERIGKWNHSQVSFASSSSAAVHDPSPPAAGFDTISTGYETARPKDSVKSRKGKLVKRRPESEITDPAAVPLLVDGRGAINRPAPPETATESQRSATTAPTLQLPPDPAHARSPSLPFAQDSDGESLRRPQFHRRRSSTTPSKTRSAERGEVIEIDSDWLGIVPFPPSPRASLDVPGVPPLPSSPNPPPRRPITSRSFSGKSHPPITIRTQAETKSKRNSGGLGQSLSNLLSRSTSALPLGGGGGSGKRAPSPAPSAKSNRSLLARNGSKRGRRPEPPLENNVPALPKSPSLSLLKKRSSALEPPARSAPSQPSVASPTTPVSTVKRTRDAGKSVDAHRAKSPSITSPSFFGLARGLSRSTNGRPTESASPASARTPSTSRMPPPSLPLLSPTRRTRPVSAQPPSAAKGQLNTSFRMPRSQGGNSTSHSGASESRKAEVGPVPTSSEIKKNAPSPQTRSAQSGHRPSLSLSSIMRSSSPSIQRATPPPVPDSALSSASIRSQTPFERPRTALGADHPPLSRYFDDDFDIDHDLGLPRRNSLSDLRIPSRISSAQKKIEEDLERVKQFAKGVEDLKALRRQYEQLLEIFVEPPALGTSSSRRSSTLSLGTTAHGARRVELDYSHWWEQARTLINLGDGRPQSAQRTSPGNLASRRDRCVSMAVDSNTSANGVSGSETETEAIHDWTETSSIRRPSDTRNVPNGGTNSQRRLSRMPSASSIETEASVGARQQEMLRGVLAPSNKGASLPTRGPPEPRPRLTALAMSDPPPQTQPVSPVEASPTKRPPFALHYPSSPTLPRARPDPSRRVSRVGVSGIREFLLRLRHRATEELANSINTLPPVSRTNTTPPELATVPPRRSFSDPTSRPTTPSHSRRPTPSSLLQHVAATASESPPRRSSQSDDEDWDAELLATSSSPSRESPIERDTTLSLRRSRTVSVGPPTTPGKQRGRKELMTLTTENMPQLLDKVKEVQGKCEACIDLLKTLSL